MLSGKFYVSDKNTSMSKVVLSSDFFIDTKEVDGKTVFDDNFKKLIDNDDVTDINWNGEDLWVDLKSKGRHKVGLKLSDTFIQRTTNCRLKGVKENER